MSVIGPVQSHYHEGSPVGKRSLRWERLVEKMGFEPGVKEWRSDGWWEWGWWERWVDKWMRRWIEIRLSTTLYATLLASMTALLCCLPHWCSRLIGGHCRDLIRTLSHWNCLTDIRLNPILLSPHCKAGALRGGAVFLFAYANYAN